MPHIQLYFDDNYVEVLDTIVTQGQSKYTSSQLSLDLSIAVGNVAE